MDPSSQQTLRSFLIYIKEVAAYANNLQGHKRRLSEAVNCVQDYIQSFKMIDLDKKGVIYPKVMQNYLIKYKYYQNPSSISRFYSKYAHKKAYLTYEDILQALMPHDDYILVATTISSIAQERSKQNKFVYSCKRERIQTIQFFTAFILQLEMDCLTSDYSRMREITRNSHRIGAILWRLLDKTHNNQLTYSKICGSGIQLGVKIEEREWQTFLYWHFHSYKQGICRADFLRLLDAQEEQKRATSACKIEQFKVEQQLFKRAEEDRLRQSRIEQAVKEKVAMMSHLSFSHYKQIVKEEHFPFQQLNQKKQLKGKAGYSRPKNLVKYVIEREA